MAIYEDILGAIDNYKPSREQGQGGQNTISLKISPMTPPTSAAGGGGGGVGSGTVSMGAQPQTGVPGGGVPGAGRAGGGMLQGGGQQLTQNPQLVSHPLGAFTDAEYEAERAGAKYDFDVQYLNVLKQLGFTNDQGQFVPGTVEQEAARQRDMLNWQIGQEEEKNTDRAVQGGTVFSGKRAENQAEAQHPFIAALAELEAKIPGQLGDLFDQAQMLITGFEISQNKLLQQAAARASARITNNPVGNTAPAAAAPTAAAPPPAAASPPPSANPLLDQLIAAVPGNEAVWRKMTQAQRQQTLDAMRGVGVPGYGIAR